MVKKRSHKLPQSLARQAVSTRTKASPNALRQQCLLDEVLSPVWGRNSVTKKVASPLPGAHLVLSNEVKIGWRPEGTEELALAKRDDASGTALLPPGASKGVPRDVVMGLDFGTSSTKVVLADRSLNAAYAVPFNDSVAISSYLLPSVLMETSDGHYSLTGNGVRHADLKLAMVSSRNDNVVCSRVCAFLALTIRSARAWMYEAKREQYLHSEILWTLAIGLPTDQAAYQKHRLHFEQLAKVAWSLAGTAGPMHRVDVLAAWRRREKLKLDDELEVRPMAELSAQIHGFVSSSHFNPQGPNIYLLVDVGAGTLDASLFHVQKDSSGTVSFRLFTHTVEPLGAANLNRHRLTWWQSKLDPMIAMKPGMPPKLMSNVLSVMNELEALKLPTDFRGCYPATYENYVKGVEVRLYGGVQAPDETFYQEVRNQVAGKVLYGAWKQGFLLQSDVKDMPFFLCGGGARHPLYASLLERLQKTQGCSWLSVKPRELALPSNIIAPGVVHSDYDRLSVAYGLSQLDPGALERVTALRPVVKAPAQTDWTSRFVDKAAC